MARPRYDHWWKEVQDINGYAVLLVYLWFVARGIGFLAVTWITVVLLGGFVSSINKQDFWRLTSIALIEILWINGSFVDRVISVPVPSLHSSTKMVKNLLTNKCQLADKVHAGHPKLAAVKRVVAEVCVVAGWFLVVVHKVMLQLCVVFVFAVIYIGLFVTTSIAIYSLRKHDYHGEVGDKTNMYPAHIVVYILCVVQGTVSLYLLVLLRSDKRIVNQVSQAYGFQDGGRTVLDYYYEIMRGCEKSPSSARERNLITYAIELIESKSPSRCLSGTLILDRLLTRQYSDQIKDPTLIIQEEKRQRRWRQQEKKKKIDSENKGLAQLIKKTKERRENMGDRKKKKEESRKKRQQREDVIIVQQRTVIKRLIGSASSTHILQKLLDTLDSKRSYDKRMREAAARIVDHVASRIRLEQFPRAINCISSLINNFEEYCRLQPDESLSPPANTNEATQTIVPPSSNTNGNNGGDQGQANYSPSESESEPESEPASEYSESEPESELYKGINWPSSSKPLNGYKGLVLTGLRILWSLAGSEDNCIIISNTKHLVSKIMAPVRYNLVHHTHHSAWSTSVVDASMRVMLRLMATANDTNGGMEADLYQQISNSGAIATMEKIIKCGECKGRELQMTAMQMLMQLRRGNFTNLLIDCFIKGDRSDVSVRKTAGKELVVLFLDSKSVTALTSKEKSDEFVGGLAEIVSQVENDTECRKSAAEILEHVCVHYTNNVEYRHQKKEYLQTLKNSMNRLMPKVRREILLGRELTGEEGKPEYLGQDTEMESQIGPDGRTNNKKSSNNTSSSPWQKQHHKLYVVLLSLYVTACEKLDLDIDAISPGEEDQGEGVAFRFAVRMVQLNMDRISADSLTMIKLSTRMVMATVRKLWGTGRRVVRSADLESLVDLLNSDTMLDLEGIMVFAAGSMTTVPATADNLDSLVKQARKLLSEIKKQESERNFS